MHTRGAVAALTLAGLVLAACDDGRHATKANDTTVLGGYGPQGARSGSPPLTDARGEPIPAPPAAGKIPVQMARFADNAALAVWVQGGEVLAATWTRTAGWSEAQPLERIHGASSEPQVASNGRGQAMALWHHTVGNIHSLRFSRFEKDTGWSQPDVLPGALPRPPVAGAPPGQDAPRLQMDAEGRVTATWPSGFHANEMQVARFTPGDGWSRAANEPVASAPGAVPAPRAPSSAQ